ncbi:MAG: hypothetical protein B6D68_01705 [spirochete symbiont of Stewartia floridana]|nr:MAG: hypothetical protein B6D68_01705 [spirochete symbiont of Stewartia floridana]
MTASDGLYGTLQGFHERTTAPTADELGPILAEAMDVLAYENPAIRPRDSRGCPGGLIQLPPCPITIIAPDLHARTGYLMALMDMEVHGERVADALQAERAQIVCVGDGFHSEARGFGRWRQAWAEYQGGFHRHAAMDDEMRENLSLMAMVMILKTTYPDGFHFLKGNHENVANVDGGGNRSFYKFVSEGEMVKEWFIRFLGVEMLSRWAEFESSLPLLAVGDRFMASHAEPGRPYESREVIEYRGNDQLIFDFTWTGNGEAMEGSVASMLTMYLDDQSEGALYFGGHRPVGGLYALRAGGRYVQIHNPELYISAVLEGGKMPSLQRNIRQLPGGKHGKTG